MVQKLEIAGTVVPFCGKANPTRDGYDETWALRIGAGGGGRTLMMLSTIGF
jgi:hypothetical protein